jgi:hypothetical protein
MFPENELVMLYTRSGLTILPLAKNSKRPKFENWTRRPKEELLNGFGDGDNIGIRIEPPLFVIDVDDARLGRLILDETPPTWIVKTRRGLHFYFKAAAKYYPKTNKRSRLIQLLAEGCQVVAPPSMVEGHQYRFLVDPAETPIAVVDENKTKLLEMIVDAVAKHEKIILEFSRLWNEGHRHNLSLWLNGALRKADVPRFEAAVIVKAICLLAGDPELNDRLRALDDTYKKPLDQIAAWSKLKEELSLIVGREEAEKLLTILPSPPEQDNHREAPRRVKILSLALPNQGLAIESIGMPNSLNDYDPKLLVYRNGYFEIVDEYVLGDTVAEPRHPRSYPYKPYVILDFGVKNRNELIGLVYREVDRFIDAKVEEKVVYTADILLSYVPDLFDTVPYIYVVGDNESGKTHLLCLFAELCYRPLAGVSHTAADLYSYLEDDVPLTIIEDEFQGSEKDTEKMKIYKAGYKRGARVARVTTFEGGRRVDYFHCYGPKIMAAERLVENKGLMQRCIVIEMVEGYPEKDHYDPEDYERFAWLRSELLKWRMRVLAGHEQLPSLSIDWLRGRNRELYLPLLTVLYGSPLYYILEKYLRKKVEEREEERRGSLEAVITRCCLDVLEESGKGEIPFPKLWEKLLNALGGEEVREKTAVIARSMDTEAYGRVSKIDVSTILKAKLGMKVFKTTREGKRVVVYVPDWEKLWKAARKYLTPLEVENYQSLKKLPNYQLTQLLESGRGEKPGENGSTPGKTGAEGGVGSEEIGSIGSLVVSPLTPQPELEEGVGEELEHPIALEEAGAEGIGEGVEPEEAEPEVEEAEEELETEAGELEGEGVEVEAEGFEGAEGAEEEVEAPRVEEVAAEYTGPICEECIYWAALKCAKHPDWIVVTPTARYARSCEYFVARGEGAGHAK